MKVEGGERGPQREASAEEALYRGYLIKAAGRAELFKEQGVWGPKTSA